MRTAILSFKDRLLNSDMSYEGSFVKFLNGYTVYADEVRILSKTDENGLIAALSADFDCVFILNTASCGFNFNKTISTLQSEPDENGFSLNGKLISVVPQDFFKTYAVALENALKVKFSFVFDKVTFKLYGADKKEIDSAINGILQKYPSVFFNTSENSGDFTVNLIYGETAPKRQVDRAIREFILALKAYIYAETDTTLSQRLYDVLKLRRQTVCTAESMTGGLIANKIIRTPGASDIFYEGFVTYNTFSKERRISVNHSTVVKHTVVSEEVAYEMAAGLLSQGYATLVITITGYAGSDVHPDKNDGLCYIGVGTAEGIKVFKHHFNGTRNENIENASNAALFHAIKTAQELDSL